MSEMQCPTSEDLNSYMAGLLAAGERDSFETHLGGCRECRHRLVVLHEASRTKPATSPAPRWLKARVRGMARGEKVRVSSRVFGLRIQYAGAMAVVILAIGVTAVLLVRQPERLPNDRLRQQDQVSTAPQLLAPATGADITSDQIEFRWAEVHGAQSYSFTLLNEKGDVLFRAPAENGMVIVNASERLERGRSYFWYVTAKSVEGTTVDSEINKFAFRQ